MNRLVMLAALVLTPIAGATAKEAERSPKAQAALDKALAGRVAGKPQSCVPIMQLRNTRIIDSQTILFEGNGGQIWRNDPPHGCPALAPQRTLVLRTSLSSHCRGDIFQVIDPPAHMTFGACGFGDFVPYEKPKK